MKITLSPQLRPGPLVVIKQGDMLTINGMQFDFSGIPDGATLPSDAIESEFIVGDVERINGVLHIALLVPISDDAIEAARFPAPIMNPPDGPLELPQ